MRDKCMNYLSLILNKYSYQRILLILNIVSYLCVYLFELNQHTSEWDLDFIQNFVKVAFKGNFNQRIPFTSNIVSYLYLFKLN
jgi:hypothetical protein